MKANEYEMVLRPWFELAKKWQNLSDYLTSSLGKIRIAPESPIVSIPANILDEYTEQLMRSLNDYDRWLDWFLYDLRLGENPASAQINGKEYTPRTLKGLCKLMEEAYK